MQKTAIEKGDPGFTGSHEKSNIVLMKSLIIIAIYITFGLTWIFVTDSVNLSRPVEILGIEIVSYIKGSIYVFLTAALIFALIYPALRRILADKEILEKANEALLEERQKLLLAEDRLRDSQKLLKEAFEQATVGFAIKFSMEDANKDRTVMPLVNTEFTKLTGRTALDLMDTSWGELTYPDDLMDDYNRLEKLQPAELYDAEKRVIKPDGSAVWVHMILSPVYLDSSPNPIRLCIIEDISKRKELERSLGELVRSRAVLLDNLQGMAYRCLNNQDRTLEFVSQGCDAVTGYNPQRLMSGNVAYKALILPQYQECVKTKWETALASGTRYREEYEILSATGQCKWVLEQGEGIRDEKGNFYARDGLIVDITKQKEQELMFRYFSDHDAITGLANRRSFNERMMQETGLRRGNRNALILVHFTKMNQLPLTRGFLYSEQFMKEVSTELDRLCSDNCTLFQVAQDRIVFYIREHGGRDDIVSLCEAVVQIVEMKISRHHFKIGVAEIGSRIRDPDLMLKYASIAASRDSNQGFAFFTKEMEFMLHRREKIVNELAADASCDVTEYLFVEYQPLIEAATKKIIGFEALARMNSRKFGMIPPMEFITIAEEEQLIIPIGKKILRQVLKFMASLRDSGFIDVCVSINVSGIQLLSDEFVPMLKEYISEEAVSPMNLVIEITESVFSDNYDVINEKLEMLSMLGIRVAIDDFGTGYSSLARERELKVTCLKIDKFFIHKISDGDGKTITSDIISMAHKLGHCVIAEGVENTIQEQYLLAHNCDYMQGYLFSKPLSRLQAIQELEKSGVLYDRQS